MSVLGKKFWVIYPHFEICVVGFYFILSFLHSCPLPAPDPPKSKPQIDRAAQVSSVLVCCFFLVWNFWFGGCFTSLDLCFGSFGALGLWSFGIERSILGGVWAWRFWIWNSGCLKIWQRDWILCLLVVWNECLLNAVICYLVLWRLKWASNSVGFTLRFVLSRIQGSGIPWVF